MEREGRANSYGRKEKEREKEILIYFLDFNVPSTAKGHLRTNRSINESHQITIN